MQPKEMPQSTPEMEAMLVQREGHHNEMVGALETIIQQNEKNNPEPILEAQLTVQDDIKKAIEEGNKLMAEHHKSMEEMAKKEPATQLIGEGSTFTIIAKKGDDGKTPIKGKDYFTEKEIQDFKNSVTPQKGKDYFTNQENEQFKKEVTPIKGKDYFDGKDGKTPIKGKDYFDGEDGKDAVVDYDKIITSVIPLIPQPKFDKTSLLESGEDIIAKISNVKDDKRLSYNALKDTPIFFNKQASRDYDFVELKDTPKTYSGGSGKYVRVKSDETGLEFATVSGGTITGSGAAGQVTFWDGAASISGDSAFQWDNTNKILRLGTIGVGTSARYYLIDDTTVTSGARFANQSTVNVNPVANSSASYLGAFYTITNAGGGAVTYTSPSYLGGLFIATQNKAGSILNATRAAGALGRFSFGAGTADSVSGLRGEIQSTGAGTITEAIAVYAAPFIYTAGTITTSYGLKVDPPGAGTTQWTASIGIGNSYIAGSLQIGSTVAPVATLEVTGNILSAGTVGATPTSGAGTRLMWIPAKASFRAGEVSGTQWDDANIGLDSFVLGRNSTASGDDTIVLGFGNIASAQFGVAIGEQNNVTVVDGYAFGRANVVDTGAYALAIGFSNTSSGTGSNSTITIGTTNLASATGAMAIGTSNTASAQYATVIGGQNMTVSGTYSFGINLDNTTRTLSQANSMAIMGGSVGVGIIAPTATFHTLGTARIDAVPTVASAANAVLDAFIVSGNNTTITGNTNITTAAGFNATSFEAPVYSAASALTITYAATITILGAPIGSGAGPATITNPYAFWVQSGITRFDNRVNIGDGIDTMTVNGSAITNFLAVHSEDGLTETEVELHRYSATAGAGALLFGARSRGTATSPSVVSSGDVLLHFISVGYDGTDYASSAEISFEVDGTPGSNDMPGRVVIKTSPDGSQTLAEAVRISSDKTLQLAAWEVIKQNSIAAANDFTPTSNKIYVTGATQINRIAPPPVSSTHSATLELIFASNPVVKHNQATGGGFNAILLAGSSDYNTAANSVLLLSWDSINSVWQEIAHKDS